jgi:hypothetical protein
MNGGSIMVSSIVYSGQPICGIGIINLAGKELLVLFCVPFVDNHGSM